MTRWEYKVEQRFNPMRIIFLPGWLKKFGEEGWELVTINHHGDLGEEYVFKRPLPEAFSPPSGP